MQISNVEHGLGQVWANRRNKPTSAFTILRMYEKKYDDGTGSLRLEGVLSTGEDGCGTHIRDLDHRSARKMFPVLKFAPPEYIDEEEDK